MYVKTAWIEIGKNNIYKDTCFFWKKRASLHSQLYRGVEQLVARWAHNPKVVSSSLAPATLKRGLAKDLFFYTQNLKSKATAK